MTKQRKTRTPIPTEIAAKILFFSDRTCCICRVRGKPVQIHHIDEDPSNNIITNLAALCLDCHNDTQIKGGFGRKLDADQVILYRNDWHKVIERQRFIGEETMAYPNDTREIDLTLATSVAEEYRERGEWELLASHYHNLGNHELRDKYIEVALENDPIDSEIVYLRMLQGKTNLIPEEVIRRETERLSTSEDVSQRARLYLSLGQYENAAIDYAETVLRSVLQGNTFAAAYYLGELVKRGLIEELFLIAFRKAADKNDLWWQVRALQELGWEASIDELVLANAKEIEASSDNFLQGLLAAARGDQKRSREHTTKFLRGFHSRRSKNLLEENTEEGD